MIEIDRLSIDRKKDKLTLCRITIKSGLYNSFHKVNFLHTRYKVAEWRSGKGVQFRTKGSLVRTPAGEHFVVALSKSHLPCLVLVEPRKWWTDDRLRQT